MALEVRCEVFDKRRRRCKYLGCALDHVRYEIAMPRRIHQCNWLGLCLKGRHGNIHCYTPMGKQHMKTRLQ